ncbi:MAG TPA: CBS domain-containing protein [Candidatus Binatia bacterium]|nr:CBS domain-containing protein [Candidatus Binatia bacterium]
MVDEIILEEEAIVEERTAEGAWEGAILDRPIRTLPGLQDPIQLPYDASVREAIDTMNDARVGCVMLVDDGRLVGVFTERDVLLRVAGSRVDIEETAVGELMTRDPECLTLDDRIAYALNRMSVGGFRHVPLVDDDGRPTGLVSMRHIVDYLVDLFPHAVLNLPPSPSRVFPKEREGA